MNIFKKEYGESNSVEDRLYDVKSCNDLGNLTETLNKPGLQKTVEKAILSKIKRLTKE